MNTTYVRGRIVSEDSEGPTVIAGVMLEVNNNPDFVIDLDEDEIHTVAKEIFARIGTVNYSRMCYNIRELLNHEIPPRALISVIQQHPEFAILVLWFALFGAVAMSLHEE